MSEEKEDNLIKQVCKELNLTYAELGKEIGLSGDSLRTIASKGNISSQLKKSIELFLENNKLKEENKKFKQLGILLSEILPK